MWCVHVKITVFHGHFLFEPIAEMVTKVKFWFSRLSRIHVKITVFHGHFL